MLDLTDKYFEVIDFNNLIDFSYQIKVFSFNFRILNFPFIF